MNTFSKCAVLLSIAALAACSSMRGWTPVVDTTLDKHPNTLNTDLVQCKQLADQAADATGTMLERGGIGVLGGAAGGALLGAIAGAPGTGAALGAVTGVGGGVGSAALESDAQFRRAYINCLKQRGHPVIN
jgi:hypothetical protein